ncbi:MAG: RsmE family RNA methyltransferase [Candidatus Paceibacteria bacterium]
MKIHRFIGDFDFNHPEIRITDTEIIKQIRNVLKLEPGETLILSDGKGTSAEIIIETIQKSAVLGVVLSKKIESSKGPEVTLYLAILKKENFELAVQKATEVGVHEVIPIITERTIKTGLNMGRLQKITKEASEQSGRSLIPTIGNIMTYEEALEAGAKKESKTVFHLSEKDFSPAKEAMSHSIFIGPEGGFTDREIALARTHGYDIASLGALTLRGETAAIVATYRAVQGI